MYRISDTQIDYILNDISARGVEMESLQQNLLDHVCCIIENNLDENGDFESFYQKTIKTFYKDALWEIEEETIQLLTFKNYYTMKKLMIYSGTLSVLGFIAGSIFKIMHWPGANAMLLFSMVIISFVFLPLLFVLKSKEHTRKRDKLIIALGTGFGILFCVSTLFKIQHWPGANALWLITLGMLMLVFIPIYFFTGIRNAETKINTIITTIILIAAGVMLFAMTSLRSSKQVYIGKTYNYLQDEELITRLQQVKNDSAYNNSEIPMLSREIQSNCSKIKSMIVFDQLGQNTVPVDFETKLQWMDETGLGNEFIQGGEGYILISKLKDQINNYNSLITKIPGKQPIENIIEKMLNMHLLQQSNYNLLSGISQIQLFILLNEKEISR
ncbi:MAG: hypothetical protein K0S26_1875 [Bacteroidota bacterium]|jgi:transcriptional regulator CtsR|nr:hypothetical protein [Bacteroidota bacterium]